MSQLAARVAAYIGQYELLAGARLLVVGVSGGADSLCLLHVLRELAPRLGIGLHLAHLDHGLRGAESDADAEAVRAIAGEWDLPVTIGREDVAGYARAHRLALEEAARQLRYAFLAATAAGAGASHIAVGHHADDQAETVLMHFLRGSGPGGLRGMLPIMPLTEYRALVARSGASDADLLLIRPLLAERRADIDAYCAAHGLAPRVDTSNADTRLYRNRLRHELLPILRTYNPGIDEVLSHTALVMARDSEVLQDATARALSAVEVPAPPDQAPAIVSFDRRLWRALPAGLQAATLRAAVVRLRRTLRNINWEHVEHAVRVGQTGATGDSATIAAGLELRVDYDRLHVGPEGGRAVTDAPQVAGVVPLAAPGETEIGRGWRVGVRLLSGAGLPVEYAANDDRWTAYLDADATGRELALRPRRPGDRFHPLGLGGHAVRLNEYMINVKVPAAERGGWPVLDAGCGIAWVCGLRVDQRAAIGSGTERVWEVRFERWAE